MTKSNKPDKSLTFEQAIEKLETLVDQIEEGKVSLEESIEKYAEGTTLIKHCRTILAQAEQKIQLLAKGDDNELQEEGELDSEEDSP
jgi:exodeoxyribonuclease VII small subunit